MQNRGFLELGRRIESEEYSVGTSPKRENIDRRGIMPGSVKVTKRARSIEAIQRYIVTQGKTGVTCSQRYWVVINISEKGKPKRRL